MDKVFNFFNDIVNWFIFGIYGMIREVIMLINVWFSEYWVNMIGMGGLMVGIGYVFFMIKLYNLLIFLGGGVKINLFICLLGIR